MTLRLATAALALAALPGAAGAVAFPQADLNHDGYVTFAEAEVVFPNLEHVHFDKCDPNRDGRLDAREYPLLNSFYWIVGRDR
jgi:hypothetical protein